MLLSPSVFNDICFEMNPVILFNQKSQLNFSPLLKIYFKCKIVKKGGYAYIVIIQNVKWRYGAVLV